MESSSPTQKGVVILGAVDRAWAAVQLTCGAQFLISRAPQRTQRVLLVVHESSPTMVMHNYTPPHS
jgi:hypothetical protein